MVEQKIITRKEAAGLGLKKYFIGKRCKYGHIAERYVSSGNCCVCRSMYMKKYREENREKIAELLKKYYERNKENIAVLSKKYYEENRVKIAERDKKYREKNRGKIAERDKKYYEENRGKIAERQKKYNRKYHDNLEEGYIKKLIKQQLDKENRDIDIPQELIALKRDIIASERMNKKIERRVE